MFGRDVKVKLSPEDMEAVVAGSIPDDVRVVLVEEARRWLDALRIAPGDTYWPWGRTSTPCEVVHVEAWDEESDPWGVEFVWKNTIRRNQLETSRKAQAYSRVDHWHRPEEDRPLAVGDTVRSASFHTPTKPWYAGMRVVQLHGDRVAVIRSDDVLDVFSADDLVRE